MEEIIFMEEIRSRNSIVVVAEKDTVCGLGPATSGLVVAMFGHFNAKG